MKYRKNFLLLAMLLNFAHGDLIEQHGVVLFPHITTRMTIATAKEGGMHHWHVAESSSGTTEHD